MNHIEPEFSFISFSEPFRCCVFFTVITFSSFCIASNHNPMLWKELLFYASFSILLGWHWHQAYLIILLSTNSVNLREDHFISPVYCGVIDKRTVKYIPRNTYIIMWRVRYSNITTPTLSTKNSWHNLWRPSNHWSNVLNEFHKNILINCFYYAGSRLMRY